MNSPTEKEIIETALTLSKIQPGRLPLSIFNEIARIVVTPVIELVPLYKDASGEVYVLLFQRSADDLHWPGMYHIPGTIVLASDNAGKHEDAIQRIIQSKLNKVNINKIIFVESTLCKVNRGMELAIVYSVNLSDRPDVGSLYKLSNLPSDLIEGQRNFILAAANNI